MTTQGERPEAGRAVVLLSGGLDSATCLAIAASGGMECHCLTVAYGQRHDLEVEAASRIAAHFHAASHQVIHIDLRAFGGSALTDDEIEVPKSDQPFGLSKPPSGESEAASSGASASEDSIPVTYVPARNTIFLSYALGFAEVLDASRIYVGVNAVDYSGYPDCRPAYLEAFQRMADLATRAGLEGHGPRLVAPLLFLTKPEIIQRGLSLGVDYGQTHSCYDPAEDGAACGKCDACRIRIAAFEELGMTDPSQG